MKEKVYVEIGIGNPTFLSTEIDRVGKEIRVPRLLFPQKRHDFYLRFWIFKIALIISTADGIKFQNKDENKFKILFGTSGVGIKWS